MSNLMSDPTFYIALTAILSSIGGALYNNNQINNLENNDKELQKKLATLVLMVNEQHKKGQTIDELSTIIEDIREIHKNQKNDIDAIKTYVNQLADYLNIIIKKNNEIIDEMNRNGSNIKNIKIEKSANHSKIVKKESVTQSAPTKSPKKQVRFKNVEKSNKQKNNDDDLEELMMMGR